LLKFGLKKLFAFLKIGLAFYFAWSSFVPACLCAYPQMPVYLISTGVIRVNSHAVQLNLLMLVGVVLSDGPRVAMHAVSTLHSLLHWVRFG
jgi:hypothetical protein